MMTLFPGVRERGAQVKFRCDNLCNEMMIESALPGIFIAAGCSYLGEVRETHSVARAHQLALATDVV